MAAPDTAASAPPIRVEVVYCAARSQVDSTRLELAAGASIADALRASGVLQRHRELDPMAACEVGIWGRLATPQQPLRDGDRVELYRRLLIEPKDARRIRQQHQLRLKAAERRAGKAR